MAESLCARTEADISRQRTGGLTFRHLAAPAYSALSNMIPDWSKPSGRACLTIPTTLRTSPPTIHFDATKMFLVSAWGAHHSNFFRCLLSFLHPWALRILGLSSIILLAAFWSR